jgi:CVNH domain
MLQNGHADVQLDVEQQRLSFSYKRGNLVSHTVTHKEVHKSMLSYHHATFDLAQLFANHDGHIRWGTTGANILDKQNLSERTRNWTLNETRLLVELRTDHGDSWKWDAIDLNYRFRIGEGGELVAIRLGIPSEEDGEAVVAVATPVSQADWLKPMDVNDQRILQ